MSIVTIKFLSSFPPPTGTAPVIYYTDPFNLPEATMSRFDPVVSKTPESWEHVYDTVKTQRIIQSVGYEIYIIEEVFAMNININSLVTSNHVLIETDTGDSFYAVNIIIEANDTSSRDTSYKITFRKQNDYKNELSSDFAKILHSTDPVNTLEYTVKNPGFAFNNITIYIQDFSGTYKALFKVPVSELTEDFSSGGGSYYLHTNNPDFNAYTDTNSKYLTTCKVYAKDADFITFYAYILADIDNTTWTDFIINNLEIDHEAAYPPANLPASVVDVEKDVIIYTFINPIYSNIDTDEDDITKDDLVKYKGRTVSEKQAYLKCWFTTDELWKAKYLRYAQEITLTLASGLVIVPISKTDIIIEEPRESLSELYEFNLKPRYEHQVINNNRENIY